MVLKGNLEEMYVFACLDSRIGKGSKETFKKTWEALDAELEAVIKMRESLDGKEKIYQPEMIKIIGKKRYEEVKGRELDVFLDCEDDPDKSTSRVWARREDFERYLKLYTNQKL
ncbi:MAG: hypothetical protein KAR19_14420 [Bacteroidales bacterium]|nr:hypothetical protein [Bacteroidales bacterium]